MILKAGTYRFNEVLNGFPTTKDIVYGSIPLTGDGETFQLGITHTNENEEYYGVFGIVVDGVLAEWFYYCSPYDTASQYVWNVDYEMFTNYTLENDTAVDKIFGEWFIVNTNYNEVNGSTETPLAPIRKFKETIDIDTFIEVFFNTKIPNHYFSIEGEFIVGGTTYNTIHCSNYWSSDNYPTKIVFSKYNTSEGTIPIWENGTVVYTYAFEIASYVVEDKYDANAIAWLKENTEEVNLPLAEITYNGQTIAQLNAGETCTLKCAGLPMATDIIVKINEVN